jgi:hypothetical protein
MVNLEDISHARFGQQPESGGSNSGTYLRFMQPWTKPNLMKSGQTQTDGELPV